jgi:cytidine diphosphoramidate kinase
MHNLESKKGLVIWITGYSGAGKTTIAKLLTSELNKHDLPIAYLDGDELREILITNQNAPSGYDRNERLSLSRRYSSLAKLLTDQGLIVVVATISLYKEIHQWNRTNLENYYEVFLDVPLEIRQARDPKGIYNRYARGLERNVAGLDLEADVPNSPDLTIRYREGISPENQMFEIINGMKKVGLI